MTNEEEFMWLEVIDLVYSNGLLLNLITKVVADPRFYCGGMRASPLRSANQARNCI